MAPLHVWTGTAAYMGHDRLDISRKERDPLGIIFAPSTTLLQWAAAQLREHPDHANEIWDDYVTTYTDEMRESYKKNKRDWHALFAGGAVTLVCSCQKPERCHRTLLAGILAKMGATLHGER